MACRVERQPRSGSVSPNASTCRRTIARPKPSNWCSAIIARSAGYGRDGARAASSPFRATGGTEIGGFESRFTGWGNEDNDFAERVRRAGHRAMWSDRERLSIFHVWHPPILCGDGCAEAARKQPAPRQGRQERAARLRPFRHSNLPELVAPAVLRSVSPLVTLGIATTARPDRERMITEGDQQFPGRSTTTSRCWSSTTARPGKIRRGSSTRSASSAGPTSCASRPRPRARSRARAQCHLGAGARPLYLRCRRRRHRAAQSPERPPARLRQ